MAENGMLIGEYKNAIDEKGRIFFPSKLRAELTENVLVVTQGIENCLLLYTLDEWNKIVSKLREKISPFNEKNRLVLRRFIAPAQEIEFDKSGRISIPQSLREYAGLQKETPCLVRGMISYIEIWDSEAYRAYDEKTGDVEFCAAVEELGVITL